MKKNLFKISLFIFAIIYAYFLITIQSCDKKTPKFESTKKCETCATAYKPDTYLSPEKHILLGVSLDDKKIKSEPFKKGFYITQKFNYKFN